MSQQTDPPDAVESLVDALDLGPAVLTKLGLTLGVIVLVWLVRRLLLRVVSPRIEEPRTRYQWSKTTGYVAFVLALALIAQIWLEAIRNLGTFLGLLSAGLAIALKDLVANTAGWGFILLRHPFVVGDRIQVGDHRGDVVDIRIFQFTLLEIGNWVDADQSTGRVIHVPNAKVFTEPLANYTAGFPYVWHEIPVLVTFESNWRNAKAILERIAEAEAGAAASEAQRAVAQASRAYLIYYRTLTPKVYTEVKDSGVLLTLRFISPVRQRRGITERIWEAALEAFAGESDVDLAYPTRRVYLNPLEGKEGARRELPPPLGGRGEDADEG